MCPTTLGLNKMQKRKYLILFDCVMICLLFLSFINTVASQPTIQLNLGSSGIIQPLSLTQTNLAPIPTGWFFSYGSGHQIIQLDTTVVHNGNPSIRIDQHTSADVNTARECNSIWIPVKPGDHLVFKCWIKISNSGYGDTNPYSGARIGVDFYDSLRIGSLQSPTYPETDGGVLANYVHWGTNGWVQRTIEFIVPNTMPTDGYPRSAGGSYIPTGVILWMQVWSSTYGSTDPGQAWFANAEFYINP